MPDFKTYLVEMNWNYRKTCSAIFKRLLPESSFRIVFSITPKKCDLKKKNLDPKGSCTFLLVRKS